MRKILLAMAMVAATLLSGTVEAGGRPIPMIEVIDAPVAWPNGKPGDPSVVQAAIVHACADKGWICTLAAPGLIHAVLVKPDWKAELDIPFSVASYSIKYSASEHLDYDATKHVIHRNFNRWLVLLRERIDMHTISAGS
jgi:hypothetical protein